MKTEQFKVVFDEPEVEITRVVNSTFFHYGFLTNIETGKEYEFSLCEMYDANCDHSTFELTFVNDDFEVTDEVQNFIVNELSRMEDEREEEESIENEVYNLSEDEAKDMLIGYMIENKEAKRLLREAADFIDVIRFEEGEAIDENDLESEINKFLSE